MEIWSDAMKMGDAGGSALLWAGRTFVAGQDVLCVHATAQATATLPHRQQPRRADSKGSRVPNVADDRRLFGWVRCPSVLCAT